MKLVQLACGTLQTSAHLYYCGLFCCQPSKMSLLSIFLISQLVNASVLKEKYARMKRGRRNNWFTNRALSYDWLVSVLNNVFQFIQRILSPLSTSSRVFSCFCFFYRNFSYKTYFVCNQLMPTLLYTGELCTQCGPIFRTCCLGNNSGVYAPAIQTLTKLKLSSLSWVSQFNFPTLKHGRIL